MLTLEQMNRELKDYCTKKILNSSLLDWKGDTIKIDNMYIILYETKFQIIFYKDNTQSIKIFEFYLTLKVDSKDFSKFSFKELLKERRTKKLLIKKHKEIKKFTKERTLYDMTKKAYDSLPLSEIRRKKLENLEGNE